MTREWISWISHKLSCSRKTYALTLTPCTFNTIQNMCVVAVTRRCFCERWSLSESLHIRYSVSFQTLVGVTCGFVPPPDQLQTRTILSSPALCSAPVIAMATLLPPRLPPSSHLPKNHQKKPTAIYNSVWRGQWPTHTKTAAGSQQADVSTWCQEMIY